MKRLLLILQFYDGDRAQAMQLARLIADLQPRHCGDVDFMFACRFDSSHDEATVFKVASKFRVWTHVGRRATKGWPAGCNDLFFDTLAYVHEQRVLGFLPDYEALQLLEADDCPLQRNWWELLSDEWRRVSGVKVMGTIVNTPEPHINGNCLLSGSMDFLNGMRKKGSVRPTVGWDYALAKSFQKAGWADTPLIRSYWNTKTLDWAVLDSLSSQGVALLHGVKDDSALRWAREKILRQGV